MKKIMLTILLGSILVLGLTGCGETKSKTTTKDNTKTENKTDTKKTKIGKSVQEIYDEVKCSEIHPACVINGNTIYIDTNYEDTGNPDDDNVNVFKYIMALQDALKFDDSIYQDMLSTYNENKTAESEYAKVKYYYFPGFGLQITYELK